MKSRFTPTKDKLIIPDIHSDEYGNLYQEEIFKSKYKATKEYNYQLEVLLKQVTDADNLLQPCLDSVKEALYKSSNPSQDLLLNVKQLKTSLKLDTEYKECIEPLQEVMLWIKAIIHLYNLVHQINQLRIIVTTPVSQDYVRRMKNFLEDFSLVLKEHKLVEGASPFSFKKQRTPHLKCAKQFDDLLLYSLKIVRSIQNFAQITVNLALHYLDFEFNLGEQIEISLPYMDMIGSIIQFYSPNNQSFTELEQTMKVIPNPQIYQDQVVKFKQLFREFKDKISFSDFSDLNSIFVNYSKLDQPIYNLEQLRIDLLFILNDEEDFPTIVNSFKRVCLQTQSDLDLYEKLIVEIIQFTQVKKRDIRIAVLKDLEQYEYYIKDGKKSWQNMLKQAMFQIGNYLKDQDKQQNENAEHYLKDMIPTRDKLKQEVDNYCNSNLILVYDKLIELFNTNLK